MSKVWEPQSFETLKYWIDTILTEASDDLNDWEGHFITEMLIKVNNRWPFTPAQEAKLESIYVDKTK